MTINHRSLELFDKSPSTYQGHSDFMMGLTTIWLTENEGHGPKHLATFECIDFEELKLGVSPNQPSDLLLAPRPEVATRLRCKESSEGIGRLCRRSRQIIPRYQKIPKQSPQRTFSSRSKWCRLRSKLYHVVCEDARRTRMCVVDQLWEPNLSQIEDYQVPKGQRRRKRPRRRWKRKSPLRWTPRQILHSDC